jgi:hypothetical protein
LVAFYIIKIMTIKNLQTWLELTGGLSESQQRWQVALQAMELGRGGVCEDA